MTRLYIVDESHRACDKLKSCFKGKYDITSVSPQALDTGSCELDSPDLFLYLSKGEISRTRQRVTTIRNAWPKSFVLLVFPSLENESQLGDEAVPAHRFLFKPCTKKRVIEAVENYSSMISGGKEILSTGTVLNALVEFIGGLQPNLYMLYNRVVPLMMTLCSKLGYDWSEVQAAFTIYIITISSIDRELADDFLGGDGRNPDVQVKVNEHVQKMAELLNLSPSTQNLAQAVKYLLKRYDGKGLPKDNVKEQAIPIPSRVIRLLMDYHHLLQGGQTKGKALFILNQREGWYDSLLLTALIDIMGDEIKQHSRDVYPLGLMAGMEIAEDVYGTIDGKRRKILSQHEILTDATVDYLQRHSEDVLDITEPIKVVEDLFTKPSKTDV